MSLRQIDRVGERWIVVRPCWQNSRALDMLYKTGIDVAAGIGGRVFDALVRDGRAEILAA